MDSLTQFTLGAALGQAVLGRKLGWRAALAGGLVATIPDLDVMVPFDDPIADFTYHMMQWHMPPSNSGAGVGSLVGHDLNALGIPSMESYIERYCERTGRNEIGSFDFYFA